MVSTATIEKDKIRTMKKDILEAGGTPVYPKQEIKDEVPLPEFSERSSDFEPIVSPETSVEEEAKKAEELAEVIAVSAEKGEDITDQQNVLEKISQEESVEEVPLNLPIEESFAQPINQMEIPAVDEEEQARIAQMMTPQIIEENVKPEPEEEVTEETIPEPEPEPEIQPIIETPVEEEPAPEPVKEEPAFVVPELPKEDSVEIPEVLPSAKELGLEEPELPSPKELGLEEPKEEVKEEEEEIIVEDPNEVKLRLIAEKTFDIEDKLKIIAEEKAPFEKTKAEINEQIDNLKKKLDMILEKKKGLDLVKKEIEEKELASTSPDDKRGFEKERWKIEEERTACEKEKDDKEDEIKSLKLQIRECDLNCEKVLVREKDLNQELQILTKDRDRIILGQAKEELVKKMQPLESEIEKIKREMFENTKIKDKAEKNLTEIIFREKSIEDEIKLLEKREGEAKEEAVIRDIETRRRSAEDKRRALEKDRWDHEDKVKDVEEKRGIIKEKYQEIATRVRQIKKEILEIEEKIK